MTQQQKQVKTYSYNGSVITDTSVGIRIYRWVFYHQEIGKQFGTDQEKK